MSNEHITDEMIRKASQQAFYVVQAMPDDKVNGDTWDIVFARTILALRPAEQPAATHIGSLNTREQIFQNGHRIGFKAGQQTVTAAPAAQPVGEPDRVPMTDEQFEDWWVTLADYNISGRRMYREQAVMFLKAIEAHHGITTPKATST